MMRPLVPWLLTSCFYCLTYTQPVCAQPFPPVLYEWTAGSNTGSFIYDRNAPLNPVFELTWDQASVTHSGEAIQYNVTRDSLTGTQYFFTGGQTGGQGFFSILMQHPSDQLPDIPSSFSFNDPGSTDAGFIGGSLVTGSGSVPMTSIVDEGLATLPPNNLPVLTSARINGINADLVIDESGSSTSLVLDAQATDEEAGFLYFTIDGDGPTAAANTGARSLRSSQTVNRSVPGDDSNGQPAASYEFVVTDPRGDSATITRTVTVRNVAPTISLYTLDGSTADINLVEGGSFSVSAAMQATDPGADAITFEIGGVEAGTGGATPGSTRTSNTLTLDFSGQSGSYPVEFKATDDDTTSTQTRHVNVQNIAPTITSATLNGEEADLVVSEGAAFDVLANIAATDPGPDAIEFFIDGQPAGVGGTTRGSIRQGLELVLPFEGRQDGAYPVLFEAHDDEDVAFDVRTITVENVAPTVTSLDLSAMTINEGQTITASMTATDPGPDSLAFNIFGVDAGTGDNTPGSERTSQTITLGPFSQSNGDSDTYNIVASALDDGAVPGELSKTLTVLNLPPDISFITEDSVVAPGEVFRYTALASDPGFDSVRYRWDTDNDGDYDDREGTGSVFNPNRFTPPDVGVYPIRLLVDDFDGGETTATILVAAVALAGDYNNDGTVDLGDYTVWRKNLDLPWGTLVNDPTLEAIGTAQYELWKANFGNSSTSLGGSDDAAVPEPSTCILLTLFALATMYGRFSATGNSVINREPAKLQRYGYRYQLREVLTRCN